VPRPSFRRVRAATLLVLCLAIGTGTPALAGDALPAVPPDDFYVLDTVPAGPDGELLRSVQLFAPGDFEMWAILYRSTGLDGEPIAVSGLVTRRADRDAATPARPFLAIAHGTTGLADVCAPSRDPIKRLEVIAAGFPAADEGWIVVATDYAGLGTPGIHPYLDGPSEGRAVLHSILAAQQLVGVGASDRAALQGVSQGGHAVLWAAELAPVEAPGVDVVGVVAAAPAADLVAIADWTRSGDETSDSWVNTLTVAVAWSQAYGLPLEQLLNADGLAAAPRLETECRPDPDGQPLDLAMAIQPEWDALLVANSAGRMAAPMPILYLQGTEDAQIPVGSARVSVEKLCAAGSVVDYREIPDADHAGSLYGPDRLAEARAWLADRLAGRPVTTTCAPR